MDRSAHLRYLLAKWLLILGLIAVMASVPLAVAYWGTSVGALASFVPIFGLAAVALSTAFAIFNFFSLRKTTRRPTQMELNR